MVRAKGARWLGTRHEGAFMVTVFEIMPVLAMAMVIVLIPVVGHRPEPDDAKALSAAED
jgi:hypothetical protein